MGERSSEINQDIRATRAELGSNLQQLEHKVKGITDWREQFHKSPFTMIGLAFGGGLLLATATGGRRSRPYYGGNGGNGHDEGNDESRRATNSQMKRASDTWDTIKGALIGVAAGKAQTFLKEAVPGFGEEFQKVQKREHPQLEAENPVQV